ncbi:MAG TPA: hypothetical protein VMY35_14215 [Phycisphaerae bacterium]|nr:hypothetical protein [Phycisphaerae bacterium]
MRGAWILALAVSLSAAMAAAQEAPEEEIGNPLGLTPAQRDALTQVFRRHTFAAFPDPAADAPLGVRLDPTVPGALYRMGPEGDLPPRLRVTVRSPGSMEPVQLEYLVVNFYGRKVADGTITSAVPDAAGIASTNLVLNELDRFGYYHVTVKATAGGEEAKSACGIAVVEPVEAAARPASPWGLVAPAGTVGPEWIETCRRLGVARLALDWVDGRHVANLPASAAPPEDWRLEFDWASAERDLAPLSQAGLVPTAVVPLSAGDRSLFAAPGLLGFVLAACAQHDAERIADWRLGRPADGAAGSPAVYRRRVREAIDAVRGAGVPVAIFVTATPEVLADVLTEGPALAGADGLSLVLDAGAEAPNLRLAAYRRTLDYGRRLADRMGVRRFSVDVTGDPGASPQDAAQGSAVSPQQEAWDLVTRNLVALGEGAERVFTSAGQGAATPLPSAAAYAWMTHLLAGATYEGNLWRDVPLLEAHLFSSPDREVAVVWSHVGPESDVPEQGALVFDRGTRLEAWDVVGRPVGIWKGPRFVVPLGEAPVYLASTQAQRGALRERLRRAQVVGLEPATVWIESVARGSLPGRVRVWVWLQSQRPYRVDGIVGLVVPAGWQTLQKKHNFTLEAGEAKEFTFECDVSKEVGQGPYAIDVAATMDDAWVRRTQAVQVAQTPERTITVGDGLLNWDGIAPVRLENAAGTRAEVWTAYDRENFYFAAAVYRGRAGFRGGAHAFDGDAIQLAWGVGERADDDFGERGRGLALPPGAFRDTDHLMALAFGRGGAQVIRLRRPGALLRTHLEENMDPWYGPVEGARASIGRDEEAGVTLFEASIPMKELAPLSAQRDRIYRFAFRIGDSSNEPLEWAREAGVPDHLANPASWLPAGRPALPCQTWWAMTGPKARPSAP